MIIKKKDIEKIIGFKLSCSNLEYSKDSETLEKLVLIKTEKDLFNLLKYIKEHQGNVDDII